MFRHIVAIVVLSLTFVSAFKLEDIPAEYRDLIPQEAKDFLKGLTDSDKAILKEAFKNHVSSTNEEEAIADLKKKSPELGAKAEKLHATLKRKMDALGSEAQAFAKEMLDSARHFKTKYYYAGTRPTVPELQQSGLKLLDKYKALSEAAKADFQKQFPIISKIITSERLAKFLGAKN